MIALLSSFLSSRIVTVVLLSVLAAAGLYLASIIQSNAVLRERLKIANASSEQLSKQLAAEISISKTLARLNVEVANEKEHDGCPCPRILWRGLDRLHGIDTSAQEDCISGMAFTPRRASNGKTDNDLP